MALSLVTGPTVDPLTLAEAKDHLRETSSDQDGLIAGYILAAREYVEAATHRKLITQTWDFTVDDSWPYVIARGYCRRRIELPVLPIASITSLTYVDSNGATQTLAADQYVLRDGKGPVAYVEPAYGVTWPTVRCQTAAITVRYVAGGALSEVPNQLMQAMRMLIAHAYANREAVNVGNIVTDMSMGVEAMLSSYRFSRPA